MSVLSKRAGLKSPNALYNFKNGRSSDLDLKTIEKIAPILGVTVDNFWNGPLSHKVNKADISPIRDDGEAASMVNRLYRDLTPIQKRMARVWLEMAFMREDEEFRRSEAGSCDHDSLAEAAQGKK